MYAAFQNIQIRARDFYCTKCRYNNWGSILNKSMCRKIESQLVLWHNFYTSNCFSGMKILIQRTFQKIGYKEKRSGCYVNQFKGQSFYVIPRKYICLQFLRLFKLDSLEPLRKCDFRRKMFLSFPSIATFPSREEWKQAKPFAHLFPCWTDKRFLDAKKRGKNRLSAVKSENFDCKRFEC
jgi:hypothetical protein